MVITIILNFRDGRDEENQSTRLQFLVLVIMLIFFFVYVGLEHSFGAYISVFAVKCKLGRFIISKILTSSTYYKLYGTYIVRFNSGK